MTWVSHAIKVLYPSFSIVSLVLFFFDSTTDYNSYWIEILKYTFGIIGSLALIIFTFYYRKMLEIDALSKERDEKLEAKIERRILKFELDMKDKDTDTDLQLSKETIDRTKNDKNMQACILLLRETLNTGDKSNLDLKLFLKD